MPTERSISRRHGNAMAALAAEAQEGFDPAPVLLRVRVLSSRQIREPVRSRKMTRQCSGEDRH